MSNTPRPQWDALTLDARDLDAPGEATSSDGRAWPTVGQALATLRAEGWELVGVLGATRAQLRYALRRPATPGGKPGADTSGQTPPAEA